MVGHLVITHHNVVSVMSCVVPISLNQFWFSVVLYIRDALFHKRYRWEIREKLSSLTEDRRYTHHIAYFSISSVSGLSLGKRRKEEELLE